MLAVGWRKVWKRLCKQHGRWHLKPWCPMGDPGILQTPWVPRAAFTRLCRAGIGPWRSCCLSRREVQVMGSGKHKEGGRSALAGVWGWCLGRERAAPCKGIWGEDGLWWDWVNPACFAVFSRITVLQAGVCPCPEGQAVDGQRGLSPGQLRDERVAASAASALQLSCSSTMSHFSQEEGATQRCCKTSFCHSAGSRRVTCAHQYPTGRASVADLCWADAFAAPQGAAGSGPAAGPRELN